MALSTASLFWAGNLLVGRAMHADIPPVAMAFWRWFIAGALLAPSAWAGWRMHRRVVLAHWRRLALLGVVGAGFFNALCYLALGYTTATNAAVFNSLVPVIILLLGRLFFRLPTGRLQLFGVALSSAGVVVIITGGDLDNLLGLHFNRGDLIMLFAMVLWSLYTLLLRGRPAALSPPQFLGLLVAFALPPLFVAYALEVALGRGFSFSWPVAGALAYLGVFPSVLAFLCYNAGVAALGAARAGTFVHLVPVFGVALAGLVLGETLHPFHLAALALVFSGIYLASRGPATA